MPSEPDWFAGDPRAIDGVDAEIGRFAGRAAGDGKPVGRAGQGRHRAVHDWLVLQNIAGLRVEEQDTAVIGDGEEAAVGVIRETSDRGVGRISPPVRCGEDQQRQ